MCVCAGVCTWAWQGFVHMCECAHVHLGARASPHLSAHTALSTYTRRCVLCGGGEWSEGHQLSFYAFLWCTVTSAAATLRTSSVVLFLKHNQFPQSQN